MACLRTPLKNVRLTHLKNELKHSFFILGGILSLHLEFWSWECQGTIKNECDELWIIAQNYPHAAAFALLPNFFRECSFWSESFMDYIESSWFQYLNLTFFLDIECKNRKIVQPNDKRFKTHAPIRPTVFFSWREQRLKYLLEMIYIAQNSFEPCKINVTYIKEKFWTLIESMGHRHSILVTIKVRRKEQFINKQ